ncbi:MAG: hypothetical protein WA734_05165 [Candidatus Acidiferrales bacterium]
MKTLLFVRDSPGRFRIVVSNWTYARPARQSAQSTGCVLTSEALEEL